MASDPGTVATIAILNIEKNQEFKALMDLVRNAETHHITSLMPLAAYQDNLSVYAVTISILPRHEHKIKALLDTIKNNIARIIQVISPDEGKQSIFDSCNALLAVAEIQTSSKLLNDSIKEGLRLCAVFLNGKTYHSIYYYPMTDCQAKLETFALSVEAQQAQFKNIQEKLNTLAPVSEITIAEEQAAPASSMPQSRTNMDDIKTEQETSVIEKPLIVPQHSTEEKRPKFLSFSKTSSLSSAPTSNSSSPSKPKLSYSQALSSAALAQAQPSSASSFSKARK